MNRVHLPLDREMMNVVVVVVDDDDDDFHSMMNREFRDFVVVVEIDRTIVSMKSTTMFDRMVCHLEEDFHSISMAIQLDWSAQEECYRLSDGHEDDRPPLRRRRRHLLLPLLHRHEKYFFDENHLAVL